MRRFRVRAPELRTNGEWLNTPEPLTLAGLRGRVVLLDFWTSGCVNCLHVLDELRPLEAAHPDDLVVIGVHSPKFAHEATIASVRTAAARYGIDHPVLSDPDMTLWRQYAVRAWPTLVLIDQHGYVVAQAAGEGQVGALELVVDQLLADAVPAGTPPAGRPPAGTHGAARAPRRPSSGPDELVFPAKVIVIPPTRGTHSGGSLLVANAGGHNLLELTPDGRHVLRHIGSGRRGRRDGDPGDSRFNEPNGVALLPADVAATVGYDVVVADTVNHVLRGVRLSDGAAVATIDLPRLLADARTVTGPVPEVLSPWDVVWWPLLQRLVVAAAGVHLLVTVDPAGAGTAAILAGTTVEGIRDGPALDGWLAQPSGFAVDGDRLWFADAESSALRFVTIAEDGTSELHTAIGQGLFDFGHRDGPADDALLQHPLGVTLLPDGSIAVLDTYNGAVRRYDPAQHSVGTLAAGLAEPSGAVLLDGALLIVESAANRLTRIALPAEPTAETHGDALPSTRPATVIGAGPLTLRVRFEAPPGRKLDDSNGPSTRLTVTSSPPDLIASGAGGGTNLLREVSIAGGIADGVLHVSAQAASCDDDPAVPNPACYLARQDWAVPVTVTAGGPDTLDLVLFQ